MKIKIINRSKHSLPQYGTRYSAGMDVRANLDETVTLGPGKRALLKTGLFLEIPEGFEAQIRPRSGLAISNGVTVLNSPGTIDADYRGEVCIILINLGEEDFAISDGDRICQMVFARHERAEFIQTDVLNESIRGAGGFGHTGKD